MIHAIWVWWKSSPVIANASGRSFIIAANAVSNSMRGLTLTEMTATPNVGAAACISSKWRTLEALSGFREFIEKYGLGRVPPGRRRRRQFITSGYLVEAASLEALAGRIGVGA